MSFCDDIADEIEPKLRKSIADWLDSSGVKDNYYRTLLDGGQILGPSERAIANFVASNFHSSTVICEPGTGYGQLAILLATIGYDVIAFEADWRYPGTRKILDGLAFPSEGKVDLVNGWYPQALGERSFDLLVATNIINSHWERSAVKLEDTLRGKDAVVDLRTWWRDRDQAERDVLERQFLDAGYSVEPVSGSVVYLKRQAP